MRLKLVVHFFYAKTEMKTKLARGFQPKTKLVKPHILTNTSKANEATFLLETMVLGMTLN